MKKNIILLLVLSFCFSGCTSTNPTTFDGLKYIVDNLNIMTVDEHLMKNKFQYYDTVQNNDDDYLVLKPFRKLYKAEDMSLEVAFYNNIAYEVQLKSLSIEPYLKIKNRLVELNYNESITYHSDTDKRHFFTDPQPDDISKYLFELYESENEKKQIVYVVVIKNKRREAENRAIQLKKQPSKSDNNGIVRDTVVVDYVAVDTTGADTYSPNYTRYNQFDSNLEETDDKAYKALFSGTLSYVDLDEHIIEVQSEEDKTYQTLIFRPKSFLINTIKQELILGRKIKCLINVKGEVKQIDFYKD